MIKRLIRQLKENIRWIFKPEHAFNIGTEVYVYSTKRYGTITKLKYRISRGSLFYPFYLVKYLTPPTPWVSDEYNKDWVSEYHLTRSDITREELMPGGDYEYIDGNGSIGGWNGIIAQYSGHYWGNMDQIYITLDEPVEEQVQPKLRIFTSFPDIVNRNNAAAFNIFRPEYAPEYRAEKILTNEELQFVINTLNSPTSPSFAKFIMKEAFSHPYPWNYTQDDYIRSQPSVTNEPFMSVWQQLIFIYNEHMKELDNRRDFLDIKMPIPDYTKLKS